MTLEDFKLLMVKSQPHALTRYGDGEHNIFDDVNCHRKGFKFNSEEDQKLKADLLEAYNSQSPNYYVADKDPISACLFVNQYYPTFLKEVMPLFNMFKIIYVGHETSDITNLPFHVDEFFPVCDNAWKYFPGLYIQILREFRKYKKPILCLFACGPYSNILINKIWKHNKKQILWNIGSTLDPFVYGVNTRQYHERMF